MKQPNPTDTLIFLHIPKAAGETLYQVTYRQYQAHPFYRFTRQNNYSVARFAALPEEERRALRFVGGHIYYGVHQFIPRPSIYISMFRDPFEQLVSHYYFFGREEHKKDLDGFARFLQRPKNHSLQLDRIVGYDSQPNAQGEWLCEQNRTLPTEAKLEIVERQLRNQFAAIGLVEHFDESLLIFRQVLGWRNIYYTREHYNAARPRSQESLEAHHALIREYAVPDLQFYALVKTLYEEQRRAYQGDLAADLHTYQRNNQLIAPLYRASLNLQRSSLVSAVRRRLKRR